MPPLYDLSTLGIHGDDWLAKSADIAPPLHVSTTFRYSSNPDELGTAEHDAPSVDVPPVYSRMAAPNTTRLEAALSAVLKGHAVTYASGLAAFHAMMVFLRPNVVAIGQRDVSGYHGCHGVLDLLKKLYGLKIVDLNDEKSWDAAGLGKGDVVHLETPINPSGEAFNIRAYADKAHARGAYLTVDSTFGPPTLQNPLEHGADCVMHSGTKYLGGHSDMLCGVLVVPGAHQEWFWGLRNERMFLGSTLGNMEGWLGLRSLRTLDLRVKQQSRNAENLVSWLYEMANAGPSVGDSAAAVVAKTVYRVQHASLQKEDFDWLRVQMPNGFGPVFALWLKDEESAKRLPSKLKLFHHATSVGGVESLVEWRRISDPSVDPRLLRFSIGVENWEDLRDDLLHGLNAL
ncbi:putative cystathionine gamma-synthase protein [Neofusicoccum parvum UCRNP2]|uniref:Putative cystathionine gamma-synthase protein n=1 Tax=Botryosphaeria parva (strain UCR-NP2) TaxID=1287680 RepID=R1ELG4_BOTPV|nr:putative cystathionine gamma-synthase protein [Neofusicoccum parvum UCRNP2]